MDPLFSQLFIILHIRQIEGGRGEGRVSKCWERKGRTRGMVKEEMGVERKNKGKDKGRNGR